MGDAGLTQNSIASSVLAPPASWMVSSPQIPGHITVLAKPMPAGARASISVDSIVVPPVMLKSSPLVKRPCVYPPIVEILPQVKSFGVAPLGRVPQMPPTSPETMQQVGAMPAPPLAALPPTFDPGDLRALGVAPNSFPPASSIPPSMPPRLGELAEQVDQGLPRMLAENAPAPIVDLQFNTSRLNEVQTRLIKELAGGAARHDPARRDQCASREQAKNSCLIDVRRLKFCHVTISPTFMNGPHRGLPVLTLLDALHRGTSRPEELAPLLVMKHDGLECVCGNRRLYCLKRYAAEASVSVNAWCIVYDLKAQETPRNLVMKYILAKTTEDGEGIRFRHS